MVDMIKEPLDICLDNIADLLLLDYSTKPVHGLVTGALGTIPIRAVKKFLLIDRFQYSFGCHFNNLLFHAGNPEWTLLLTPGLGNILPRGGAGTITLISEGLPQ
jgi:hypothetical protein